MRASRPSDGLHVLMARLDADGDVLLTGPAVRAVAAGARRVTYLCSPRSEPVARLLPGVDEVVAFEAAWVPADPPPLDTGALLDLVRELAARAVDQAVVMTSFHQSPLPLALLLRMAGVPEIAAISVDYPGSLLDVRHVVDDHVHQAERNLSLVATLGYSLPAGDDGRLAVLAGAPAPGGLPLRPYIVVHPGASVPARAWAPERHAELVARLAAGGRAVVVTGGPGERNLCARVAGDVDGVVNLGGETDHAALAAVLAGADAVVVGNTGPAHLAAAVGTPVVSLFAPTVPASSWAPWQVPHALLGDQEISCAGCRALVCPYAGHPCLAVVDVDEVIASLDQLVGHREEAA